MLRVHAGRKVYNNAIAYLNKNQGKFSIVSPKGITKTSGHQAFRSFCKTIDIVPDWCKDLGIANALDNNLMEAYKAWKKTDRQSKDWKGKPNKFAGLKLARFRSIRDLNQTIQFDPGDYANGSIMTRASKGLEKPLYVGQDYCLINYDRAVEVTYSKGRWTVNMPVEMSEENIERQLKVCAIDPGVRTFATVWDGQYITEIGSKDFGRIARLCQHLDLMVSKRSLSKNKRFRFKISQSMARLRLKIKNLRAELHKQLASRLARTYDVIFLPTFETSQMVKKVKRKIRSKTARAMLTWGHYQFQQTLQHLCNRYDSRLVLVTEEYTSKTCSRCGHIHADLGSKKKFVCPECGHTIDRDWNGAFNIMLKALWDTTLIESIDKNHAVFRLSLDNV